MGRDTFALNKNKVIRKIANGAIPKRFDAIEKYELTIQDINQIRTENGLEPVILKNFLPFDKKLKELRGMKDEEAMDKVRTDGITLITMDSETGFWKVKYTEENNDKRYYTDTIKDYGLKRTISFTSNIAAAIHISQTLGPFVSRSLATNFIDDTKSQVLTNLRIPSTIRVQRQYRVNQSEKECANCGCLLTSEERSWCSQCHRDYGSEKLMKWRGKSSSLFQNCKHSTKVRNGLSNSRPRKSLGRGHDIEWQNIDEFREWMATTLEKENFKCYYGAINLSPTNVSLERLDEDKGYSSNNCVLIDRSFQTGFRQWSREKVQNIPILRKKCVYDDDEVERSLEYECLEVSNFGKTIFNQFGDDISDSGIKAPLLFTRLQTLFANSKLTTRARNAKGRDHEHTISVRDLISIWRKQRGRCHWLDIPLNLTGDWQVSIERLDESVGYVIDNIVLVALETQSPSKQWTSEFVKSVWG
jgi:hypothetical protein